MPHRIGWAVAPKLAVQTDRQPDALAAMRIAAPVVSLCSILFATKHTRFFVVPIAALMPGAGIGFVNQIMEAAQHFIEIFVVVGDHVDQWAASNDGGCKAGTLAKCRGM